MSDTKNKSKSQLIPLNTNSKTKNINTPKINFTVSQVKLTPQNNTKSSLTKVDPGTEIKIIYPPSPSPESKPNLTNSLTTLNKLNDTSNLKPSNKPSPTRSSSSSKQYKSSNNDSSHNNNIKDQSITNKPSPSRKPKSNKNESMNEGISNSKVTYIEYNESTIQESVGTTLNGGVNINTLIPESNKNTHDIDNNVNTINNNNSINSNINNNNNINSSLYNIMNKINFSILDRIIVNDNNKIYCKYLKTSNPQGFICFIELSEKISKNVIINDSDSILIIPDNITNNIPYSIKIGSYDYSKHESCSGIVFECYNGYCIIKTNDETLDPYEENYSYENDINLICSSNICYPLVLYDDLIYDDKYISNIISESSLKLNEILIKNTNTIIEGMKTSIQNIYDVTNIFDNFYKEKLNKISSTLNILDEYYEDYDKNPPVNSEEQNNLTLIRLNMRKRRQLFYKLIDMIQSISSYNNKISTLSSELSNIYESEISTFDGIDDTFTE